MRIRIDTPIAKLTADLTEEQIAEILGITLDYAVGFERPVYSEPNNTTSVVVSAPAPIEPVLADTHSIQDCPSNEYKGFLYIECKECGKFKAFMPKTPISRYRCDCGHITHLKDMRAMRVDCKCGASFKYLTNAKHDILTMDCYNCGSPVDLEYHDRKQGYVTIKVED